MGRWAPAARERLESAAWELFTESGYETTTVADIAERAGLNRATFFRHFADKREVALAGGDALAELLSDGIRHAPTDATPSDCVRAALAATATAMTTEYKPSARRRIAIVATNADLQERGQLKFARTAQAIADALRARDVDIVTARIAGDLGLLAFRVAFERWIADPTDAPFAPIADGAWEEIRLSGRDMLDG